MPTELREILTDEELDELRALLLWNADEQLEDLMEEIQGLSPEELEQRRLELENALWLHNLITDVGADILFTGGATLPTSYKAQRWYAYLRAVVELAGDISEVRRWLDLWRIQNDGAEIDWRNEFKGPLGGPNSLIVNFELTKRYSNYLALTLIKGNSMDARRSSKQRHEWSYRMEKFRGLAQSIQDFVNQDPNIVALLGDMSKVLQDGAQRANIADPTVIGVTLFPVPYRVWAGKIETPWSKEDQKLFRVLGAALRKRFNMLYSFVKDSDDMTNAQAFEGGIGGIGGVVEDGTQAVVPASDGFQLLDPETGTVPDLSGQEPSTIDYSSYSDQASTGFGPDGTTTYGNSVESSGGYAYDGDVYTLDSGVASAWPAPNDPGYHPFDTENPNYDNTLDPSGV